MLWIRCCRLMRRRKVHEQAQNYKEKAIILANPSGGLGSVPPPVWLRQTVQGAFYPGPLIGSRLRRGEFSFSPCAFPRGKHHLFLGGSPPPGPSPQIWRFCNCAPKKIHIFCFARPFSPTYL